MAFRSARLLAPLAAGAVALIVAACCCQRSTPCERKCDQPAFAAKYGGGGGLLEPESTTFQRLVVTNKHTKSVLVTAMGWRNSSSGPVQVPLQNSPATIPPGGVQSFPIQVPGTNINHIVVTYLAADDSDQVATTEHLPVVSDIMTRCIQAYEPDVYTIADTCQSACPPPCPLPCAPACPPACRPVCR